MDDSPDEAAPPPADIGPILVATGGLVASGKSTLARALAEALGATRLEADVARAALAERDEREQAQAGHEGHEVVWERQFRPGFTHEVYAALLEAARRTLEAGRPVVVDGCFATRALRGLARNLAQLLGVPFVFVEARVPLAELRRRLEERSRRQGVETDEWLALLDGLAERWEPADELPAEEHALVDTTRPLDEALRVLAPRLRALAAGSPARRG